MTILNQNEELFKMNTLAICDEVNPSSSASPNTQTTKHATSFMEVWSIISQPLSLLIIFFLLWGIGIALLPQYTQPSTAIMRLLFLFIGGQICGIIVSQVGIPDMLGMLFWGLVYKNIGFGNFDGYDKFVVLLREFALANTMLLGGLELYSEAIKNNIGLILRLTFIPTIIEIGVVAVLAFILLGMPPMWGILLGLLITAASPNIVVTVFLRIKGERLGLYKGIHSVVISATTFINVGTIFVFNLLLGVALSQGDLTNQLLHAPIGIVIGILFGFIFGTLLIYMPSEETTYCHGLRFTMATVAGIVAISGGKSIGYPGAGVFACVIITYVAATGWRSRSGQEYSQTGVYLDLLWKFLKPVCMSSIGKEVDFKLFTSEMLLNGVIIIYVAALLRFVFSYIIAYGDTLNWKERAYVALSGFPKATLQTSLGPIALHLALKANNSKTNVDLSTQLFILSVLTIILTAPPGALLLVRLAPKMLKRTPPKESDNIISHL